MKKSLVALMMATVLCLCACATAETIDTFGFTAEQYVESFQTNYPNATAAQEENGLVLQTEEGAPVLVTYDMNGLCTVLSAEVKIPLTQSESANSEGQRLGLSATSIMTSARSIDLGGDDEAILEDMGTMIQGFTELLTSFSDEDYENCITEPVTHEAEICTHLAQMTFSFDLLSMSMVMTFCYLP